MASTSLRPKEGDGGTSTFEQMEAYPWRQDREFQVSSIDHDYHDWGIRIFLAQMDPVPIDI